MVFCWFLSRFFPNLKRSRVTPMRGWVGSVVKEVGGCIRYTPESPGPAISCISNPMGPRPQHTMEMFASSFTHIVSLITTPSFCNSLYIFHRISNQSLIRADLTMCYCFICAKRKWTSVTILSMDFISCVSKPAFFTSSHVHSDIIAQLKT